MSFFNNQEGQGLLEYALVLILVAVVIIAIITLLGPEISERLCPYISLFCSPSDPVHPSAYWKTLAHD